MARLVRQSTSTSITPESDSTLLESIENTLTPATSVSETSSHVDISLAKDVSHAKPPQTRPVTQASIGDESTSRIEHDGDTAGNDLGEAPSGPSVEKEMIGEGKLVQSRVSLPNCHVGTPEMEGPSNVESTNSKSLPDSITHDITDERSKSEETKKKDAKVETTQRRRSGRLTLLERTKTVLNRVSSILGKRQRGDPEKDKDTPETNNRRSGLRSRNITQKGPQEVIISRKKRIFGGKPAHASPKKDEEKDQRPSSAPQETALAVPRRKKWLSHGLYAGENAFAEFEMPTSQSRRKGTRQPPRERTLFPMPKYSGALLLEEGRPFKLPYDIFSPLPRGQPKPDEWRKINKNIFIGDAASIWKATMPAEQATCLCTVETGCEENCQNRHMLYECDNSNCKLGDDLCRNRNFAELRRRIKTGSKYHIGVEVIKTESRGYGVRSNRTFFPNQIIVEYTGEILTQIEAQRRMNTIYKKNECFYLMDFDQDMIIDATRGSIARFVNHSCEPNCKMEKWIVAGKPRIALFAGDNGIMTGEELTYDYNFDPYSNKNVQECRCGTPSCRGVLGPRPKGKDLKVNEKAASQRKPTAVRAGVKRKADAINEQASKKQKSSKPTSITSGLKRAMSKASTSLKSKAKTMKVPKRRVNVRFSKATGGKPKSTAAASVSFTSISRTSKQQGIGSKLRMPSRVRARKATIKGV